MSTATDQIFEFDDLDDLWNRVKDLEPDVHLAVKSRTIMAQGVISEMKEDARFREFTAQAAPKHKATHERTDLYLFTIHRTGAAHK